MRLNSKKSGRRIGSFTFYEKPVAETLCLPWRLLCVLMKHQREGEAAKRFWNYHCQNQGGMCYRHKLTGLINGPQASWALSRNQRRLVNRLLREYMGHIGHVSLDLVQD